MAASVRRSCPGTLGSGCYIGLFLHEGVSHLDQAAEVLDLFLWDVGTGECSKPEHLREALGIQLVILGDQLAKLDSIGDLDTVALS